jgi:hypothetical protein
MKQNKRSALCRRPKARQNEANREPPAAHASLAGGSWGPSAQTIPPQLSIAKTHDGEFAQCLQVGNNTVTVSNATQGIVTVTNTPPPGLALVGLSGANWSCNAATCTRNDPLAPGDRYSPITVTVNAAADSASPQINSVTVSGGGSSSASATDSTTIAYWSCDLNQDWSIDMTDVQKILNQALGMAAPLNDLDHDGNLNVAELQKVIHPALALGCPAY